MNYVKVLGHGRDNLKKLGSALYFSQGVLIDTGNVGNSAVKDPCEIKHIFLTDVSLGRLADILFILELSAEQRKSPLKIYGSSDAVEAVKRYILDDKIGGDFLSEKSLGESVEFKSVITGDEIYISDISLKIVATIENSLSLVATKGNSDFLIIGDLRSRSEISQELNRNLNIKAVFLKCKFPNRFRTQNDKNEISTPDGVIDFVSGLENNIKIFIYRLKNIYAKEIKDELNSLNVFKNGGKVLEDGDFINANNLNIKTKLNDVEMFERMMDINLKLSAERDNYQLYDMILTLLRDITQSDGGTLYLVSEDKKFLEFKVVQNDSLNIFLNTKDKNLSWRALPIYTDGEQNRSMIAVVCALDNKIINLKDIYHSDEYNFEGVKKFDKNNNYRTKSMLVVPLTNHENDVIGVVQLVNKDMDESNSFFTKRDEKIMRALSLQAAMALTNTKLIESLENFLEAFVTSIANAIDAKSRHTSTHISKISVLVPLIARSIHEDDSVYKDVKYDPNEMKELELAAKLHDIGKISIPEWVIDKSTKLQKLIDGLELVRLRAEIIKRDMKISMLAGEISSEAYEEKIKKLSNDFDFIVSSNLGGEFMRDEDVARIGELSSYKFILENKQESLINEDEIYNLSIRKGTLTKEEKDVMNSHAKLTYDMLSALSFPKKYSDVMHIASNHHEKLNGKGYPRGLSAAELTLEDRILILADIFEALTSSDRPYKKPKKLSEAFKILDFMAKDGEIDADLLNFFKQSEALKIYCETELKKEQIDV